MASLELTVTRTSLQVRHAMLSRTPEERAATLEDIGKLKTTFDGLMTEFEKALSTEGGRKRFQAIKPAAAHFWAVGGQNIAMITDGKTAEAFAFLVDRTIPARKCAAHPGCGHGEVPGGEPAGRHRDRAR